MKGWNTYFHKLKKIWIYKKPLSRNSSQKGSNKEKVILVTMKKEDQKMKRLEIFGQMVKYYIWPYHKVKWNLNLPKCKETR
jgi:hypothetical protein